MPALSRRAFLASTIAGAGMSRTWIRAAQGGGTRLILLGTGGGPRPRMVSSASAQVIVSNNLAYVIDCGDGVARQLVFAGVPLTTLRHIFITHHHSDHNADYGNLIWLAWTAGLSTRVDAWGPPPLEKMTKLFFEMNANDINARISNERRMPLVPLVQVHEFRKGGAVMSDENVKVTSVLVDHEPGLPSFAYRFDARVTDVAIRLVRRINAGEPFDLLVAAPAQIDALIKTGQIIPETRTDLARSGIGVAVRAGAPTPDVSSVDAFKRALLAARSIAYLKEGQSGVYIAGALDRLGIADALRSKLTLPETDIVSQLVSRGEIELGIVVITQTVTTPGVALAGPLPAEIQSYITFTGGISAHSKSPDAAKELLRALKSPSAVRVMRSQAMEPGTVVSGEELAVLSAVGMRQVMLALAPTFEQETGHQFAVTFDSGAVIARRVQGGEAAARLDRRHAALPRARAWTRPGAHRVVKRRPSGLARPRRAWRIPLV